MKCLILILTLFSTSALAAGNAFDLRLELSLDGKKVASPRLTALAGETASISQLNEDSREGTFIEVIANDEKTDGEKGILLKFVVGKIDASGRRQILATPRILTLENEKASITIYEDEKALKESVSLSVIPQRTTL